MVVVGSCGGKNIVVVPLILNPIMPSPASMNVCELKKRQLHELYTAEEHLKTGKT